MSSNEIPLVSATISRRVKRLPDKTHSDGESNDTGAGGGLSAELDATDINRLKSKRRDEDDLESAVPAKRLRICSHEPRMENMPTRMGLRFGISVNGMCASSSRLSKWQSPRTSPLGPMTSKYCRRSRELGQPSKGPNETSLLRRCVGRNLVLDNRRRNPDNQSAQWCEDLSRSSLKETLHPTYRCPHLYHPSDPEYDEEWPDESWSDEEWSDSEDTLPTSDEDQVEADVRVIAPEEPSQAPSSKTFTFVHWDNWGTPLSSNSNVFHSPNSWHLGADAKELRSGAFSETTGIMAAA